MQPEILGQSHDRSPKVFSGFPLGAGMGWLNFCRMEDCLENLWDQGTLLVASVSCHISS